ncbi:MAG: right-handed parallel beta-helix repeat-containing protein [Anaerolineales bacterium]|nr:right-handed parallel beta-helix repeat-containing protein [Anaerolineales bacterium]
MRLSLKIQLFQIFLLPVLSLRLIGAAETTSIPLNTSVYITDVANLTTLQTTTEGVIQASANYTSTEPVSLTDTATAPPPPASGSITIYLPLIIRRCQHTIELNVSVADARTNYSTVKPGDTVCVMAGSRNKLTLKNFRGTVENPITFINHGGQVLFNQTSDFGISARNSQFIRITGTGNFDIIYGFKIDGNYSAGVSLTDKSSNFEVDHIEVARANYDGILAKTDAVCPDGSTNQYDYDGDGQVKGDLNDIINRSTFTQYNSIFHDNYIHDTLTEGFYVGSSFYSQGESVTCENGSQVVMPPLVKGVEIYNNIVEDTGWDGIQVGSAVENCAIHHNKIYRDSWQVKSSQESGIMNNKGSVCDIYNNLIQDGGGPGIYVQGNGNNKIYNNLIINPGQNNSQYVGYGIKVTTGSNTGNSIYVWHNTIINPKETGISFQNLYGSDNMVQNNIIIQSSGISNSHIVYDSHTVAAITNNLKARSLLEAKFTNPSAGDYSLRFDSPAVDAGVDLSTQGINTDYQGGIRPQGGGFDLGAFEFGTGTAELH